MTLFLIWLIPSIIMGLVLSGLLTTAPVPQDQLKWTDFAVLFAIPAGAWGAVILVALGFLALFGI